MLCAHSLSENVELCNKPYFHFAAGVKDVGIGPHSIAQVRCGAFERRDCQRSLALTHEHIGRARIFPLQPAQRVADQDQGRIAKSMTPLRCRGGDDLSDFLFRQIFPVAIFGVGAAPGNFPFYDGWGSRDGTLASPLFVQGEAPDFPLLIYSTENSNLYSIGLTDPLSFLQCAPSTNTSPSCPKRRKRPYAAEAMKVMHG